METSDTEGQDSRKPRRKRPVRLDWKALTPEQKDLVRQHLRLVRIHLRHRVPTPRQPHRGREYDDLFQEGCIGLIRAAARYQPARDGPFPPFALPRIRSRVHAAVFRAFTLLPVPRGQGARELEHTDERHAPMLPPRLLQARSQELDGPAPATIQASGGEDGDSICHLIRRRFEHAVRIALAEMRARTWAQRNPCAIMARLAHERLLVPVTSQRTALRCIAREAGVASSRAYAYEQQLTECVRRHFGADAQVRVLLELAGRNADGFAGRLDESQREKLRSAQSNAFDASFLTMSPQQQAVVLCRLIEKSGARLAEVAHHLYRFVCPDESLALCDVDCTPTHTRNKPRQTRSRRRRLLDGGGGVPYRTDPLESECESDESGDGSNRSSR